MKKIKVVHCKKDKFDIYIGRPSKWGNPFSVRQYGRTGCIEKYREYIKRQPELLKVLKELRGKVLGCWCAPKGGIMKDSPLICHGQILVELAEKVR